MVTVFLCGDVMTGRGVDQILEHPGDARLWESAVRDARTYVGLAELINGPIHPPVAAAYPWGDALGLLEQAQPDVKVINLETAVTRSDDVSAGKPVCYRMNPDNIGCLTVAGLNVCTLANNHTLDFGSQGLIDTVDTLGHVGIACAGGGRDVWQARTPATVDTGRRRVHILSVAAESSGTPPGWAASPDRPGVAYLPELSESVAADLGQHVSAVKRPGDIALISIHWGSNWGYAVPSDQVRFAHQLIDAGADLVHGHSSHHPRPFEIYRGRLILYGCGDFINDYEGITGYEQYRDDLRLMYLATLDTATGGVHGLRIPVLQAHRMRLREASAADTAWLADTLNEAAASRFSTLVGPAGAELVLRE